MKAYFITMPSLSILSFGKVLKVNMIKNGPKMAVPIRRAITLLVKSLEE